MNVAELIRSEVLACLGLCQIALSMEIENEDINESLEIMRGW